MAIRFNSSTGRILGANIVDSDWVLNQIVDNIAHLDSDSLNNLIVNRLQAMGDSEFIIMYVKAASDSDLALLRGEIASEVSDLQLEISGMAISAGTYDASNNRNLISNVKAILFDSDAGFEVLEDSDGSGGVAVKVTMNSTFKYWFVDGQPDLVAEGVDQITFVAGSGVSITTDATLGDQSLTINVDSDFVDTIATASANAVMVDSDAIVASAKIAIDAAYIQANQTTYTVPDSDDIVSSAIKGVNIPASLDSEIVKSLLTDSDFGTSTAIGSGANATGQQSTALGRNANANAANSVAIGHNAVAVSSDEVRLGGSTSVKVTVPAGTSIVAGNQLTTKEYVDANVGLDSDAVTALIDSDYILTSVNKNTFGSTGGLDSDAVMNLIDSDYIVSTVDKNTPSTGLDSDAAINLIVTVQAFDSDGFTPSAADFNGRIFFAEYQ